MRCSAGSVQFQIPPGSMSYHRSRRLYRSHPATSPARFDRSGMYLSALKDLHHHFDIYIYYICPYIYYIYICPRWDCLLQIGCWMRYGAEVTILRKCTGRCYLYRSTCLKLSTKQNQKLTPTPTSKTVNRLRLPTWRRTSINGADDFRNKMWVNANLAK